QNEISHIEKTFEEPIQEKSKPVESPFSLDKEHQPPVKDEILVQENTEKNARDNSHDKVKKTSELKVMKGKPEKTQEQNIANKNKASLSTDTDVNKPNKKEITTIEENDSIKKDFNEESIKKESTTTEKNAVEDNNSNTDVTIDYKAKIKETTIQQKDSVKTKYNVNLIKASNRKDIRKTKHKEDK